MTALLFFQVSYEKVDRFFYLFWTGMIQGLVFKNSKTIYPPLFLHMLWNGFLVWLSTV
ncbi:CPBP family glutamic-type intramembrane protease [Streptococcus pneumoniae]